MAKRDENYQIVYRGESLTSYVPGGWVFFQRPKECGGGYWLGRTFEGVFMLEFEAPVSLSQGILFLLQPEINKFEKQLPDDDFSLT